MSRMLCPTIIGRQAEIATLSETTVSTLRLTGKRLFVKDRGCRRPGRSVPLFVVPPGVCASCGSRRSTGTATAAGCRPPIRDHASLCRVAPARQAPSDRGGAADQHRVRRRSSNPRWLA